MNKLININKSRDVMYSKYKAIKAFMQNDPTSTHFLALGGTVVMELHSAID